MKSNTAMAVESQSTTKYVWENYYPKGQIWDRDIKTSSLTAILDQAVTQFADRPAIDFENTQINYRELGALVSKIATGLQKLGVTKGIKVGLFLPNTPYSIAFYHGILKAGGTVVNYNPLYVERELIFQVEDSETDFLVTLNVEALFKKADTVMTQTRLKGLILCPAGADEEKMPEGEQYISYNALIDNKGAYEAVEINPHEDIAVLQYTGGTTGRPKGAMLTHANLSANMMQMYHWYGKLAVPGQESIVGIIPLFHVFSMTVVMNLSLMLGMKIILLSKFDPATIIPFLKEKQPSFFPAVPAIYNALAHMPEIEDLDLSCVKFGISGGAPLPAEVKRLFEEKTGARIGEGYGLTESSPVVTCNPMIGRVKTGSIGQPIPGTIIEIVSIEDGETVLPAGEKGEVCIRGPQVMKGYYKQPEATEETLRKGRLHTGDVGYFDDEGYVYLVDRIKDLILVRGYNVYPTQIEEAIYLHNSVEECMVAGVPDEERGETVWAWIKTLEGKTLSEDDMKTFLSDKISPIEMPRKIIMRDKPLPKTAVGKLSRKLLLEEAGFSKK